MLINVVNQTLPKPQDDTPWESVRTLMISMVGRHAIMAAQRLRKVSSNAYGSLMGRRSPLSSQPSKQSLVYVRQTTDSASISIFGCCYCACIYQLSIAWLCTSTYIDTVLLISSNWFSASARVQILSGNYRLVQRRYTSNRHMDHLWSIATRRASLSTTGMCVFEIICNKWFPVYISGCTTGYQRRCDANADTRTMPK